MYMYVQCMYIQFFLLYQIEVLASLAEEEALHPILVRLLYNIVQCSIATPGKNIHVQCVISTQ